MKCRGLPPAILWPAPGGPGGAGRGVEGAVAGIEGERTCHHALKRTCIDGLNLYISMMPLSACCCVLQTAEAQRSRMHLLLQTYHKAVCEASLISFLKAVGYTLQAYDCWTTLHSRCNSLQEDPNKGAIPGQGTSPVG